jgi:preprotein translocase subunit YajC
MQAAFGFIFAIMFTYFFYRMIRPNAKEQKQKERNRTIQDVFVSGRQIEDVKKEIQNWIREEGIVIEVEREGFIRGRLGFLVDWV